ncbi:MAG: hypothetical protein H6606_01915 [Flavobacteriales bacterium]|nr:hypothetical protein [Flavobacteriales bacterium]
MKTKMLIVLGLILGMVRVNAQEQKDRAMMMTERLDAQVELTEAQKEKVYELNKKFAEERREMHRDRSAEMRDDMQTMHRAHRAEIESVLTEEQKAKMKAHREEQKEKHQAMRKEIGEYRKTNIHPVMVEKRTELDTKLSTDEKRLIEETRTEVKRLRSEMRAELKETEGPDRREFMRENPKRQEIRNVIESKLQPIADAHKADLEQIRKDLEPQRAIWEKDMKAIHEKYKPEDGPGHGPGEFHRGGKGAKAGKGKGKGQAGAQHEAHFGKHKDLHFLLMDPSKPMPETED